MVGNQRVNVASPEMMVQLTDNLVRLRPYELDDIDELFAAARESIGEVGRWLPWCHPHYAIDESSAWVESRAASWRQGGEYSFVIVEQATGRFIGGCGLNQFDYERRRCNLGYWVRTNATRKGFATAASRLLARWGVEVLGLERFEIVAAVGNVASQRVAAKLGAMREGIARSRIRIHGEQYNAVVFSLTKSDVEKMQLAKTLQS